MGCKAFALLFDDIDPVLCASDTEKFDSSADAQASITNLIFEALDKPRFIFCPTGNFTDLINFFQLMIEQTAVYDVGWPKCIDIDLIEYEI